MILKFKNLTATSEGPGHPRSGHHPKLLPTFTLFKGVMVLGLALAGNSFMDTLPSFVAAKDHIKSKVKNSKFGAGGHAHLGLLQQLGLHGQGGVYPDVGGGGAHLKDPGIKDGGREKVMVDNVVDWAASRGGDEEDGSVSLYQCFLDMHTILAITRQPPHNKKYTSYSRHHQYIFLFRALI